MILQEVDQVSITILVDNYTDILLSSSENVRRPPIINKNKNGLMTPVAEHGFAALVELKYDGDKEKKKNKFLFDTGVSKNGILFNADTLGVNLLDIDGIILSHGHSDHYAGLVRVLQHISKPVPLYAHPDAFLKRWLVLPDGSKAFSVLDENRLKEEYGAIIYKNQGVTSLPDDGNSRLAITGQIPRITDFEKGFPFQYKELPASPEGGEEELELVHDLLINDDQALIVRIKDKGLVILTACGHAGIVNTVKYARKMTGIKNVYAIVGGFHLSGKLYENIIDPTLDELKQVSPRFIVPCHCTGWKAVNRIIQLMPNSFIQSSVGSTFVF